MTPPFAAPFRASVLAGALTFVACTSGGTREAATPAPAAAPAGAPTVGPPHGSVIVVGGGSQGPEIFAKFIELAGGPDALIIDVPTAGGDSVYPATRGGNLRAAGAKNVLVLHTKNRKVADSDEFIAPLARAGGVWFEGGRHYHLVDSYLGTKTEKAFHDILARGGVMAGSSAGASILGSYLVRGAPSNNNMIMSHPDYLVGFAFLRGVAVDQHVVARQRLADLFDSVTSKRPDLLGISEDEGTAWVVRGDIGEIIGRNKAFVYNGKDKTDPGKPYLALHPGDKYNLATRRVVRRAIDDTPLTQKFVDDVFAAFARPGAPSATVVVAQGGKVLVNSAYGVPAQPKYMPETAMPNFPLGGLSFALNASAMLDVLRGGKLKLDDPLTDGGNVTVREFLSREKEVPNGNKQLAVLLAKSGTSPYAQLITRRINQPVGMQRTAVDTATATFLSNVDDLHRWELGLTANTSLTEEGQTSVFNPVGASGYGLGWRIDAFRGLVRQAAYGTTDGKRNAFVRFPERRAAIIILTNSDNADARGMAEKIAERLLIKR